MFVLNLFLISLIMAEVLLIVALALVAVGLHRGLESVERAHAEFAALPPQIRGSTGVAIKVSGEVLKAFVKFKLMIPWWLNGMMMLGSMMTRARHGEFEPYMELVRERMGQTKLPSEIS